MDILSTVQIIAGIGTFIASMISLFTLIEMRQQRRSSMMPGLFTNKTNTLSILREDHRYSKNNEQLGSTWSKKADSPAMYPRIFPAYGIELFNVGIGTAVNIRYEWEFDVDAYLIMLQEFNTSHNITIEYRDSNPEDNGYAFLFMRPNDFFHTAGLNSSMYKVAFLPSSQSMDIYLPGEFTVLFNLLVYSWICIDRTNDSDVFLHAINTFDGRNILKLHIFYNDISGKKYKKSYSLSISIEQISFTKSIFRIDTFDM